MGSAGGVERRCIEGPGRFNKIYMANRGRVLRADGKDDTSAFRRNFGLTKLAAYQWQIGFIQYEIRA